MVRSAVFVIEMNIMIHFKRDKCTAANIESYFLIFLHQRRILGDA